MDNWNVPTDAALDNAMQYRDTHTGSYCCTNGMMLIVLQH